MSRKEPITNEINSERINLYKEKEIYERYPNRLTEEYYRVWGNVDYLKYRWVCDRINDIEENPMYN